MDENAKALAGQMILLLDCLSDYLSTAKEAETIERAREQIAGAENVAEVANRIACSQRRDLLGHAPRQTLVWLTGLEPALLPKWATAARTGW